MNITQWAAKVNRSVAEFLSLPKTLWLKPIRYTVPPGPKREAVARWQRILASKGFYRGRIDGVYGPATRRATAQAAAWCGAGFVGTVTPGLWRKFTRKAGAKPRPKVAKRVKALQVAARELARGVREVGRNRGPRVDLYLRLALGYVPAGGAAWCAAFVAWCYAQAGRRIVGIRSAYCPDYVAAARRRQHGLSVVGTAGTPGPAVPGDLALYDWDGDGIADHIGLIEKRVPVLGVLRTLEGPRPASSPQAIEGNTGGDPRDPSGHGAGDGVHRRWRAPWQVLCVVRVADAA